MLVSALLGLVSAVMFTNPLKVKGGSDPFIVYNDLYYYLITITWSNRRSRR